MIEEIQKVRVPEWAIDEQKVVIKELQEENFNLRIKIEMLTHALDSDVKIIKQAGDVIQKLGEDNAKMARILKARGLMTFDGLYTPM